MEAVRAWLQDRKNLPIVVVGLVVIIAIVAVVFWRMRAGGEQDMGAGMPGYPPTGEVGMPGPGTPTGPSVPGGAMSPQPSGTPGMVGDTGTAAGPQAPPGQATVAKLSPMLPYRNDPFEPFGGRPRPRDVLASVLPMIPRQRLAPAPVIRTEQMEVEDILPPQPFRRMAGAMWNGRVCAILETNGETDVVRPGMELRKGGSWVRVESIHPNYMILTTLDTRKPMQVKVNMSGSTVSEAAVMQPGGYGSPITPSGFGGGRPAPGTY